MRKYLGVMSAVALAASFGAQAAETLYVGGSGGSTEKLFKESIIPAFEAKTDAKVVYVAGNSTDTLAKLQAQKGKQEMSMAMIDDGPMYQAVASGCAPRSRTPAGQGAVSERPHGRLTSRSASASSPPASPTTRTCSPRTAGTPRPRGTT